MWVGVTVKAVAALGLAVSSYVTGLLPACLGLGEHCSQSLLLSLTLCFGGGVLLATSLVHILPEARQALPLWADITFCAGFTLLYFIDEVIKFCESEKSKVHCHVEAEGLLSGTIHHQYHSTSEGCPQQAGNGNPEDEHFVEEENHEISLKVHQKKSNRIGLLLAFSVHSVIEGLVIGVQSVPAKMVLLVGAVSSHKLVVSFCLGAELASDGRSMAALSHSVLVYSLGSSLGIVLGAAIDQWRTAVTSVSIPVLQALAGGSLLYVTVAEVLPRERARWEHQPSHRSAGLLQLFSFIVGFSLITTLVVYTT